MHAGTAGCSPQATYLRDALPLLKRQEHEARGAPRNLNTRVHADAHLAHRLVAGCERRLLTRRTPSPVELEQSALVRGRVAVPHAHQVHRLRLHRAAAPPPLLTVGTLHRLQQSRDQVELPLRALPHLATDRDVVVPHHRRSGRS